MYENNEKVVSATNAQILKSLKKTSSQETSKTEN
jgi:hypothetical protein